MLAAALGREGCVRFLIDSGADLDARDGVRSHWILHLSNWQCLGSGHAATIVFWLSCMLQRPSLLN